MNESEASDDPFFVSMRILKALLQPEQGATEDKTDSSNAATAAATEPRTPVRMAVETERQLEPLDEFHSPNIHDPVCDLRAKLQSAEATAEKERRLRLAVERERDEILVECQEAKKLFESPLPDDIVFLKKEALRLIESRQKERAMHLKEMDHLHLQLQQATSQRDSMQARLVASQNTVHELERKLMNAREIIQVYVAMSDDVLGDSSATSRFKRTNVLGDSSATSQFKRTNVPGDSSATFRFKRTDNLGFEGDRDTSQGKSAKVCDDSGVGKNASLDDMDGL